MPKIHSFVVRVYYEDTDAGGVVYYANYLRFTERARTEALREAGIDLAPLARAGRHFVVAKTEIAYHAPAHYGDSLEVTTRVTKLGRASMILEQNVLRNGAMIVTTGITLAFVTIGDAGATATPLPPELRAKLEALLDDGDP